MDVALEAAVCCPLAGHRFDRWGYGNDQSKVSAMLEL